MGTDRAGFYRFMKKLDAAKEQAIKELADTYEEGRNAPGFDKIAAHILSLGLKEITCLHFKNDVTLLFHLKSYSYYL